MIDATKCDGDVPKSC